MWIANRDGFVAQSIGSGKLPFQYLTFTAQEANSTISMTTDGTAPAVSLETSINDGKKWLPFIVGTSTIVLSNVGDKVLFRAGNNGTGGNGINNAFASLVGYNYFVMTGVISASGDISSILNRHQSVGVLNVRAFLWLFKDCTSLVTAPSLPAITLNSMCYSRMFQGCIRLTAAPELPATTLADSCYSYMFYGCTSLADAPSLPATTLASGCYSGMFHSCTSLTDAPSLSATTLVSSCYSDMFNGCSDLSNISVGFTTWDTSKTTNWVSGVAQSGTFECPAELSHTSSDFGTSKIPTGWTVNSLYWGLTFTAREPNSIISMAKSGTPPAVSLETSIDNGNTWYPFTIGTTTITLTNVGDKVCFRAGDGGTGGDGINNAFASEGAYNYFVISSGKIAASGDISSILNRNQSVSILNSFAFCKLFYGCVNLTDAPRLPAITLASNCYVDMFRDCTSLTTAPELPAYILTDQCYSGMFRGCSNLASISVKFVVWEPSSTVDWVLGVKESGTFTCLTVLPHGSGNFGNSKIPTGWTVAEVSYHGSPIIAYFEQAGKAQNEFSVDANAIVTIKGVGFTRPNIISAKFGKLEASGNSFAYAFNPTAITVVDANTVTCKVSAAEDPDQTDEQLAADSAAGLIVLRLFTQMTRSVNDLIAHYVQA